MPSISLLIPACNEENAIASVASDHLDLLINLQAKNLIDDFEIIILDDGSTDTTYSKASMVAKRSNKVILISNSKPSGLQNAFTKLYKHAKMEWTILTPGDGQWPVLGVELMIRAASKNDWKRGVISYRTNKSKAYTIYRMTLSFMFRVYSYLVLREDLIDPGSIKLLPSDLSNYDYRTSSPVQEVERIKNFRLKNSKALIYIEVPWVNRNAGKASGAALDTLIAVFKDFIFLFQKK